VQNSPPLVPDVPSYQRPRNLGISRQLALVVALGFACVALLALVWGVVAARVSEQTLILFVGLIGTLTTALIGTTKAIESADTSSKVQTAVHFTASQQAAMQQVLTAHCGEMCPLDHCPLRIPPS
jgi:hypothetical protein